MLNINTKKCCCHNPIVIFRFMHELNIYIYHIFIPKIYVHVLKSYSLLVSHDLFLNVYRLYNVYQIEQENLLL